MKLKYLLTIISVALFALLFIQSCKINSRNSSTDSEDNNGVNEQTPKCNAEVDIIIVKEESGTIYRYWFKIAINNIGDKNIIEAGAKYRVSFPDYTSSDGTIFKRGFSLPPGANYTYNADIGPWFPVSYKEYSKNGTLEVYDIYYLCN